MKYDIAVIGGGPAGMMAAGRAGELGARVVLLEKNPRLGVKLLATGGGRANITNLRNIRELAAGFGKNGRWLLPGLSRFGPEDLIDFFNSRGLETKVEDNNRVFPKSDSAADVLRVLGDYLKSGGVDIELGVDVKKIAGIENKSGNKSEKKIEKIIFADGREITAAKFIICAGGKSYPGTGSTGEVYSWLKKSGHSVVAPRPALAPIIVRDELIKDLEGVSLPEAKINCFQDSKKIAATTGPMLFTADGLSGPAILNMSGIIGRADPKDLRIKLDFFPEWNFSQLDQKLRAGFDSSNREAKNALDRLVPPKLAAVMIDLSGIDPRQKLNSVSREERQKLARLLKEFNLSVRGVAGFDRAMITAGGADLTEVDSRTMRSKIIANLYLAGEVLDLNGPTGGYNLQLCWTSGYLAGESAARD